MRKTRIMISALLALLLAVSFVSCTGTEEDNDPAPVIGEAQRLPQGDPVTFIDGSVHDPSVLRVGDTFYVIGSHMQAAKTDDLMNWTSVSYGVDGETKLCPLFDGPVNEELKEAVEFAGNELYWAADWIQLREDGKFYMYYCVTTGDSPHSCIGYAVADDIEGPYTDLGILFRSDYTKKYNAKKAPNAVDPQVFYDRDGKLWMVYGSYSGGIFIAELNPKTGALKKESTYEHANWGTKLTGGFHTPIEGAYIIYNDDYYYLFVSYGGLSAGAGYNMRVSRSKKPNGPYVDYEGNKMIKAADNSVDYFDTSQIQNFGLKLSGDHIWEKKENDTGTGRLGYISSGHNSAYYDAETGKYFLIFHTRFPGEGEMHQIRVHQMFMNEDGWPVVAPCRYAGETIGDYVGENIIGTFKYINHGHEVTSNVVESVDIELNADYTITQNGSQIGTWALTNGHYATITIDDVTYKGVFLFQWDDIAGAYVMTFTAASTGGVSIWGTQVYEP